MPEALTLGFDTSAAHCAAALLSGDQLIGLRGEDMAKGQAERLMPLPALTQVPPGFARPSFWAMLLCVTVLSLLPTDYLPPQIFSLWDKAQHALAFAALAALGLQAYPHRRWRVLAGCSRLCHACWP